MKILKSFPIQTCFEQAMFHNVVILDFDRHRKTLPNLVNLKRPLNQWCLRPLLISFHLELRTLVVIGIDFIIPTTI
jgi:hypothetical protein